MRLSYVFKPEFRWWQAVVMFRQVWLVGAKEMADLFASPETQLLSWGKSQKHTFRRVRSLTRSCVYLYLQLYLSIYSNFYLYLCWSGANVILLGAIQYNATPDVRNTPSKAYEPPTVLVGLEIS